MAPLIGFVLLMLATLAGENIATIGMEGEGLKETKSQILALTSSEKNTAASAWWLVGCCTSVGHLTVHDEKDRKIQELTAELRNKKRLCAVYQEQLIAFMKDVEEHSKHLSNKVQAVVNNLKEFDPVKQEFPNQR
ncbi:unnamed protein product [Ilex paraguariensis]|uniref:Uncharacterized protein n=1 Tax=Ilex paraguariensis TaxID=185542 RepID=A0ABC8UTH2_9AQUA